MKTDRQAELLLLKDSAKQGWDRHEGDFTVLENAYFALIDEGKRTSLKNRRKSTLELQMIKPKVAKVTREVMKQFFGGRELAKISAGNEESRDAVDVLKEELRDYARSEKFYSTMKPAIKEALVYGTSAAKVYFANNTVRIEKVRISDLWLDPGAQSADDVKFLVHRTSSLTVAQLKQQFGRKKIDWSKLSPSDQNPTEAIDSGELVRPTIYEIYVYRKGEWYVSTLTDGDQFLRIDKKLKDGNPFIITTVEPQFVGVNEWETVRAYGDSFISPLVPIQREYVIRRNQQIDAIDEQLNPKILAPKNSGIQENWLRSNRKKIETDQVERVKFFPVPNIRDSLFDTDKLEAEAQEISGITKYNMGMNDKKNLNQTATGMTILTQEGAGTVEDITRALAENLFRPLVTRIVTLIWKYKKSPNFARINREINLDINIIVDVGVGATNKEIQMNNISNAIVSTSNALKTSMELIQLDPDAATEMIRKYGTILDKLHEEEIRLLGFSSILEEYDDSAEREDREDAGGAAGESGAGALSTQGAGGELPTEPTMAGYPGGA